MRKVTAFRLIALLMIAVLLEVFLYRRSKVRPTTPKAPFASYYDSIKLAAQSGDQNSQIQEAISCLMGIGAPKDIRKGMDMLTQLANGGNARAQLELGQIYQKGLYVPRNPQLASEWFSRAASQGFPAAKGGGSTWQKGGNPAWNGERGESVEASTLYFMQIEQGWQSIPFFCEEEEQVGMVNSHSREQFFPKTQPFKWRPYFMEFTSVGMHHTGREDLFGKFEKGPCGTLIEDEQTKKDCAERWTAVEKDEKEERVQGMQAENPIENSEQAPCRQLAQVAISCFTSHRAVYVLHLIDGTWGYRSFDFNSPDWETPSTEVNDGKLLLLESGSIQVNFEFQKDGYTYILNQPSASPSITPTLSVLQKGITIQTEECRLFSISKDQLK